MDINVFNIKCTKCNQGVFIGKAFEEKCDHCGENISDELIVACLENVSEELKK